MRLLYDVDTDSLYIDLRTVPSVDSREVVDGIVLDIDADRKPVGIDIQHASLVLDLTTIEARSLPASRVKLS